MPNYAVVNSSGIATQQSLGTTFKTIAAVIATTGAAGPGLTIRRSKIYDMIVGCNAAPGDTEIEWALQRVTAGSTFTYVGAVSSISSAITLDQADGPIVALAFVNSSAENVTLATNNTLWYEGMNQRATFRWVANPGSEFVNAAVSSNGLVLQARAAAFTSTVTATVYVSE